MQTGTEASTGTSSTPCSGTQLTQKRVRPAAPSCPGCVGVPLNMFARCATGCATGYNGVDTCRDESLLPARAGKPEPDRRAAPGDHGDAQQSSRIGDKYALFSPLWPAQLLFVPAISGHVWCWFSFHSGPLAGPYSVMTLLHDWCVRNPLACDEYSGVRCVTESLIASRCVCFHFARSKSLKERAARGSTRSSIARSDRR